MIKENFSDFNRIRNLGTAISRPYSLLRKSFTFSNVRNVGFLVFFYANFSLKVMYGEHLKGNNFYYYKKCIFKGLLNKIITLTGGWWWLLV